MRDPTFCYLHIPPCATIAHMMCCPRYQASMEDGFTLEQALSIVRTSARLHGELFESEEMKEQHWLSWSGGYESPQAGVILAGLSDGQWQEWYQLALSQVTAGR